MKRESLEVYHRRRTLVGSLLWTSQKYDFRKRLVECALTTDNRSSHFKSVWLSGGQIGRGTVRLRLAMRNHSSTTILRIVLAFTLSFWIAGAGCILGCEGMVVSAAAAPAADTAMHQGHHPQATSKVVASGKHCSSKSRGSKHGTKSKPELKTLDRSTAVPDTLERASSGKDCPLGVGRAVVATKVRNGDVDADPALAHQISPADFVLERTSPLSPPSRLANRGHTYLHCCVFLI
jgi:hypothetical protein